MMTLREVSEIRHDNPLMLMWGFHSGDFLARTFLHLMTAGNIFHCVLTP
ncbi:MAG: hypothetical protein HYX84_02325 [Chloroflexi bacterium]|nr:hypothetical protein [Chloroflexota bacterium]